MNEELFHPEWLVHHQEGSKDVCDLLQHLLVITSYFEGFGGSKPRLKTVEQSWQTTSLQQTSARVVDSACHST